MLKVFNKRNGAPVGIRTPNLLIRNQVLYPVELQAHYKVIPQKQFCEDAVAPFINNTTRKRFRGFAVANLIKVIPQKNCEDIITPFNQSSQRIGGNAVDTTSSPHINASLKTSLRKEVFIPYLFMKDTPLHLTLPPI